MSSSRNSAAKADLSMSRGVHLKGLTFVMPTLEVVRPCLKGWSQPSCALTLKMFIQGAKVTWFKDIQRLHHSEGFHGLFWTFSCTYHSLCCTWCMNRRRHGKEPSQRLRFVVVWWFLWCENQVFKNTRLWNKLEVSLWETPASAILIYCCLTQAIILLWFMIVVGAQHTAIVLATLAL